MTNELVNTRSIEHKLLMYSFQDIFGTWEVGAVEEKNKMQNNSSPFLVLPPFSLAISPKALIKRFTGYLATLHANAPDSVGL